MTKTARVAAAAMAAAIACALLLVGATSAPAAAPAIESYLSQGEARGLDVSFTFSGSIFERLLDLGVPHARSVVSSEGGASSRGVAAQVFPGDLIIGAVGESFPGYRQAVYPIEDKMHDPADDAHAGDSLRQPGQMASMITAGPLMVDTGHLTTTATPDSGSGLVTTNLVTLGMDTPLVTVKSIESDSKSTRSADHVEHVARTVAHDIRILVSPQLSVAIGGLVAQARTTSDGVSPAAETSLKISDVSVQMNGTTYAATLDENGLRTVGAPQVSLPSPLSGSLIPNSIPEDANQTLALLEKQAGVQIATAPATKIVEDSSSEASLNGLLVTFTGTIPNVFVPGIVYDLVYNQVVPKLPKSVQNQLAKSICYERDIKPTLQKRAPQLVENLPDLPLCASPQIVPGPGSGVVTTFSIGKVHSQSDAVQAETFGESPGGNQGFGGVVPPVTGTFGGGGTGGSAQPSTGTAGPSGQPPVLTGLVARLPAAALYGAGAAFLLVAMVLAMGPSLRTWRATPEL